jgi:hypothetical protein
MGELTVHTMALDALRVRAREALRLIARAREIARHSFDGHEVRSGVRARGQTGPSDEARLEARDDPQPPSDYGASYGEIDGEDDARRVGQLLDAAQRLLPGIPSLIEDRPFPTRPARTKPAESGWRRVTLRGGAERALETIERARILDEVASDAAGLVAEIERRSSSVFRAADVATLAVDDEERERATRGS